MPTFELRHPDGQPADPAKFTTNADMEERTARRPGRAPCGRTRGAATHSATRVLRRRRRHGDGNNDSRVIWLAAALRVITGGAVAAATLAYRWRP
jgi:hypothetical protein